MANYWLILIGGAGILLAACTGYFLFRRGPDEAERERRRLAALVASGRITGGQIDDVRDRLVYYSYEVAGVGYGAAQDLTRFPALPLAALATLSGPVTIRYSRAHPGNSMVHGEFWSGLPLPASTRNAAAPEAAGQVGSTGAA
ncbi:MAG: hypothetical protein IT169_08185 [Bryobacterales bacterium]|nr:hypothetical protein [Bryobacterales bacterium]